MSSQSPSLHILLAIVCVPIPLSPGGHGTGIGIQYGTETEQRQEEVVKPETQDFQGQGTPSHSLFSIH